jgi:hypothetical protein
MPLFPRYFPCVAANLRREFLADVSRTATRRESTVDYNSGGYSGQKRVEDGVIKAKKVTQVLSRAWARFL